MVGSFTLEKKKLFTLLHTKDCMNKRIEELAEQAWPLGQMMTDDTDQFNTRIEKFAKSIVRECAKIIEAQDVDPAFKNRLSWSMKDKFGVEQ
jgi:hypothetical protein